MSPSPWTTAQADVETGNPRSGAGEGAIPGILGSIGRLQDTSWQRWRVVRGHRGNIK